MWAFQNLGPEAKEEVFKAYHRRDMSETYKILDAHNVRSSCSTCPKNDTDTKKWMEWFLNKPENAHLRNGK